VGFAKSIHPDEARGRQLEKKYVESKEDMECTGNIPWLIMVIYIYIYSLWKMNGMMMGYTLW